MIVDVDVSTSTTERELDDLLNGPSLRERLLDRGLRSGLDTGLTESSLEVGESSPSPRLDTGLNPGDDSRFCFCWGGDGKRSALPETG